MTNHSLTVCEVEAGEGRLGLLAPHSKCGHRLTYVSVWPRGLSSACAYCLTTVMCNFHLAEMSHVERRCRILRVKSRVAPDCGLEFSDHLGQPWRWGWLASQWVPLLLRVMAAFGFS